MAKFIYRMQNILSIKLKLEDQAKTAFGAAKRRVDEEEERLLRLEERKEGYQELLLQKVGGTLNILEIRQTEEAVEILKYKMQMQTLVIEAAKQQLELARRKLNEAIQERKIQENLREQAFLAFMEELKAEEQKEVDERVSFMYRRNSEED